MTYLSIEMESERFVNKILKSMIKGEPLRLRINSNDKEGNDQRPDYKSNDGISVWVKD